MLSSEREFLLSCVWITLLLAYRKPARATGYVISPEPIFLETTNLWTGISLIDSEKLRFINLPPHLHTLERPQTTPTSSLAFIL